MSFSRALTIILGVLLIIVLAPVSQFMTYMTANADIETATPVGWAIGIVFSLALVFAFLRLFARIQAIPRQNLVILFVMLTIAAPIVNLGLIRVFYNANYAVLNEYFNNGNPTYRTAYSNLTESWFPLVPDHEGLAWNRSDRFLRLLTNQETSRNQDRLRREFSQAMDLLLAERQRQRALQEDSSLSWENLNQTELEEIVDRDQLRRSIPSLGTDGVREIIENDTTGLWVFLGLGEELENHRAATSERSSSLAAELPGRLAPFDEFILSLLPEFQETLDLTLVNRVREELRRLSPEERAEAESLARDQLGPIHQTLREEVTSLAGSDFRTVRNALMESYLAQQEAMTRATFARTMESFVFRLDRNERRALVRQDGTVAPNQNIYAFRNGLWSDQSSQQLRDQQSFWTNMAMVRQQIPLSLWIGPIFHWGFLFLCIFLFMMCLAEYFRRKWVERENLAFPLVEIADGMIRHDAALEMADDVRNPPQRKGLFNNFFLFGAGIGFLIISLEALGHYGIIGQELHLHFAVSENLFTSGPLGSIDRVVFILSPIVIGIVFLISLELGFSIWFSFVLYTLVFWGINLGDYEFRDSVYSGWGGGRFYPFAMEQLIGASVCFSALVMLKSWKTKTRDEPQSLTGSYVPPLITRIGLILLPVIIIAMLWSIGVKHLPVLILFALIIMAITIAAARVRAETGLPAQHVSYEFTKMPIIFGLTNSMGAKNYAAYLNVVFLPWTLLFRTLPQQLENLELARRYNLRYSVVAIASLAAVITAIGAGMFSFLLLSHYFGAGMQGDSFRSPTTLAGNNISISTYPLWVGHFEGESSLDKHTSPIPIRMAFIMVGFLVIALLATCRKYFLNFPLHPIGYMVLLLSLYYEWVSPYFKGESGSRETSLIWGSVLFAWLLKKVIIKYGGMNSYKAAKPFFIGLVIGSVFCIFSWNILDFICTLLGEGGSESNFIQPFRENSLFSPRFY